MRKHDVTCPWLRGIRNCFSLGCGLCAKVFDEKLLVAFLGREDCEKGTSSTLDRLSVFGALLLVNSCCDSWEDGGKFLKLKRFEFIRLRLKLLMSFWFNCLKILNGFWLFEKGLPDAAAAAAAAAAVSAFRPGHPAIRSLGVLRLNKLKG